ncbi:MAG: ribonuclease Z [Alphaproteobacteria bacterium]|nr:ribonuclease Z [Alphaproteobacteria bacterium]
MSAREVVALGTSSQVPTRYRNHNGYLLRWDRHGILFDPGEGTQRQMIYANVSATDITRICVTHFHGDHCLGLAGITQRISLDGVPHEVPVHFPASGRKYYDRLRHASIFRDRARLVPHPITEEGPLAAHDGIVLECRALDHGVTTYGYRVSEPDGRRMLPEVLAARGVKGPLIGELTRRGQVEVDGQVVHLEEVSEVKHGQSMAFVMDTRPCDGALALARGADLLVCESTYLEEHAREAHDHFHMTARQAAELAREAGVHQLVLTHFSQRYPRVEPFVEQASAVFPNVVAAKDGMHVPLPKREKPGRADAS